MKSHSVAASAFWFALLYADVRTSDVAMNRARQESQVEGLSGQNYAVHKVCPFI